MDPLRSAHQHRRHEAETLARRTRGARLPCLARVPPQTCVSWPDHYSITRRESDADWRQMQRRKIAHLICG